MLVLDLVPNLLYFFHPTISKVKQLSSVVCHEENSKSPPTPLWVNRTTLVLIFLAQDLFDANIFEQLLTPYPKKKKKAHRAKNTRTPSHMPICCCYSQPVLLSYTTTTFLCSQNHPQQLVFIEVILVYLAHFIRPSKRHPPTCVTPAVEPVRGHPHWPVGTATPRR